MRFLKSQPEGKKIGPWMLSTSTSLAIDRLQHRAREDQAWQDQVRAAVRDEEDLARLLADPEVLRRVLAELDRETQEVVVLVRFEELTQEEAAIALSLTRDAVDERMRRFQEEARSLVEKWRA